MKKTALILLSLFILSVPFKTELEAKVLDHIKPYGNLYLFFGGIYARTYDAGGVEDTDIDLIYAINSNSNLGFNFNYAKYSGVFELGIDDIGNKNKVKIRKAYGAYKLGFGELMIGQYWSPYVKWSHEAANYYRSEGFGALFEDPTLQIKLSFGAFHVVIMKPYVPVNEYYFEQEVDNPDAGDGSNTEFKLTMVEREITTKQPLDNIKAVVPKLAAGYEYKSKTFLLAVGGASNIYYIDKTDNAEFNKSWIISYLGYFNSQVTMKRITMNISAGYIVNPANFGISVQSKGNSVYEAGAAPSIHNIATGKWEIKDTWNVQSYFEIGYAFAPSVIMHLGYGFSLVKYPMTGTKYDLAMEYYLNMKIGLGGLIALSPAVSFRDYMNDMSGDNEGFDLYAGVLATVSFY